MQIGYGADENEGVRGPRQRDRRRQAADRRGPRPSSRRATGRPPRREARLIPNRYDPDRAHLAVYNGKKAAAGPGRRLGFLKPGEPFRLMDPRDFFGKPVLTGTCSVRRHVPMTGEFAPFVLLEGGRQRSREGAGR